MGEGETPQLAESRGSLTLHQLFVTNGFHCLKIGRRIGLTSSTINECIIIIWNYHHSELSSSETSLESSD